MVSGDLHRRQTSQASSSLSYGASLGSLVVLEPRLAGPSHPARPDPPLVAPRDPQEHVVGIRGELQKVQMWHDAAGPDPSQVPIFVIFELDMKNNTFYG